MYNKKPARAYLVLVAGLVLTGCLPEETSSGPNQPPPGQVNSSPVISGAPLLQATVGVGYLFQPQASDADGDVLSFTATGLPAWAIIHRDSGLVSGTPGAANLGTSGPIVVSVSDGRASASLPAFQIAVISTAPPANLPPTITGSPATTLQAGSLFTFVPTASDPEGAPLVFSVSLNGIPNTQPGWMTFSAATGQLTGYAQAGVYSIVITATDAAGASASLAFTLTVAAPGNSGTAALNWTRPMQNTDGTALTNLAGYRVYHGLSAIQLDDVVEITGADATSHTFNGLGSGTHYFAVTAINTDRVESALSGLGSKSIP